MRRCIRTFQRRGVVIIIVHKELEWMASQMCCYLGAGGQKL